MALLLFAEVVCILFFAVAQVLMRNKQPLNYCMIIVSFALGFLVFYAWADASGQLARFPVLIGSDLPAVFIAAPAFYLSSLTILSNGRRPVRSYVVYFIGPVVFALGLLFYNALTVPAYLEEYGVPPTHFATRGRTLVSLCAMMFMVAAIVMDLLAALRLTRSRGVQNKTAFGNQVMFLFLYLASALVVVSSVVFRREELFTAGIAAAGIIAFLFILGRMSVPSLISARPPAAPRPVAREDWDRTAAALSERLTALMESQAPYRDPALSLRRLARLVGVQPKRLSYHFNTGMAVTFRGYINEWRLKAVSRDLVRSPDRSILEIAFANGFNSKSSFNTLFQQKFGTTPRDYRKEHSKTVSA
jgi:AraC-like DNA-binding protein